MSRDVALLTVDSLVGYQPEIGALLWMLQDGRRRLKESLASLDSKPAQAILDWRPRPEINSIGTQLYHIAAIETDWLFEEVLAGYTPPAAVAWPDALLPHAVRDELGRVTYVVGETMAGHWQRLDTIRSILLDAFKGMSLPEFRRPRHLEQYHVTPEWVLHHLVQHEAEHRGQIMERRAAAEQDLSRL